MNEFLTYYQSIQVERSDDIWMSQFVVLGSNQSFPTLDDIFFFEDDTAAARHLFFWDESFFITIEAILHYVPQQLMKSVPAPAGCIHTRLLSLWSSGRQRVGNWNSTVVVLYLYLSVIWTWICILLPGKAIWSVFGLLWSKVLTRTGAIAMAILLSV